MTGPRNGYGCKIKVGKRVFKSIKALAKYYEINYSTLYSRLQNMSASKAVALG